MAEIKVTLVHPTNNGDIEVQFDDSLTANAVIDELINAQFLSPFDRNREAYAFVNRRTQTSFGGLSVKGETTFKQAGVIENDRIQISIDCYGGG